MRPSIVVTFSCAALLTFGCGPKPGIRTVTQVSPTSPGEEKPARVCIEAQLHVADARKLRSQGRLLRALALETRASKLCPSVALPPPVASSSLAEAQGNLESVLGWISTTNPQSRLSLERLPDAKQSRRLEQALVALGAKLDCSLIDERSEAPESDPPWDVHFDRVTLHRRSDAPGWSYAAIETASGRMVAEFSTASSIEKLDANHFVAPVAGSKQAMLEVWQVSPLERLRSIPLPKRMRLGAPELVRTNPLPVPIEPRPPNPPAALHKTFVPDRLASTRAPGAFVPSPHAEAFEIQELRVLEGGLVWLRYDEAQSLIDWQSGKAVLHLPCSSEFEPVSSADGRWVSFGCGTSWLGVYDHQRDESRLMTAPGLIITEAPAMFSPDGSSLASGGLFELGFLWDPRTGQLLHTLPEPFPWVAKGRDQDSTKPVRYIRQGRELLIKGAHLRRFEVASGRELPVPSELLLSKGPEYDVVERSDGSVAFINRVGCLVGELTARNEVVSHACANLRGSLIGIHSSGEWFVRNANGFNVSRVELVSTRGNKILWHAETADRNTSYSLNPDASELRGSNGSVYSLPDGQQLWPGRDWAARGLPDLQGEVLHFASNSTVDLAQGRYHVENTRFRGNTTKKAVTDDYCVDDDPITDAPEVCLREASARCNRDRSETIAYLGSTMLGKRSGCDGLLAISEDGREVVLETAHGARLWQPSTGEERPVLENANLYRGARTQYIGPHSTLLVFNGKEMSLLDLKSGNRLWEDSLSEWPQIVEFTSEPGAGRLRIVLPMETIGWDLGTGKRAERWPNNCAHTTLRDGRVLVFTCENEARVVQVSPLRALFSVANRSPNSLIVTAPDGRFEILGERRQAALHLRCSMEGRKLPLFACSERFEWPGLFEEVQRELRH